MARHRSYEELARMWDLEREVRAAATARCPQPVERSDLSDRMMEWWRLWALGGKYAKLPPLLQAVHDQMQTELEAEAAAVGLPIRIPVPGWPGAAIEVEPPGWVGPTWQDFVTDEERARLIEARSTALSR